MNRRAFCMAGMAGAAGCRRGPRLNVYNWSSYLAPDTLPRFEAETGVRVRYGVYESNEEMLAKVMTGNSGWDVVFPSNYLIGPMRENRLLARLDPRRLPHLANLEGRFRSPAWDPDLEWSVPYMWGATGIAYNRRLSAPPARWAAMWDPALKGRMTMLDDPAEVLGAALKKIGCSLNSKDAHELRRAQSEAVRQKHLLRAYLNAEVRDQLVAGDVLAAQLWATTAQQAIDASAGLGFAYPAEGFAVYVDNAVILAESRRYELAHRFIDYLLRPEVAAGIARYSRTATANGAARVLLRDRSLVLYPDEETLARGELFEPMSARVQRLRDRIWTEIKSA